MKNILLVLLLISSFTANAQISVTLKDSLTKQPVSYANIWVLGENIGTTADENGNFILDNSAANKRIAISCVGFDRKEILINADSKIIYLKRADNLLKEVSVTPRLRNKTLVVGKLKKKVEAYHVSTGYPWITGRFFAYLDKYTTTPYITSVRCYTRGEVNSSKFSLRLYTVNSNGVPDKLLHDSPIYAYAQKGKNFSEIDISDFNIKIPESGIVVAMEWLIVPENKYDFEYYVISETKVKTKMTEVRYAPDFISNYLKKGEVAWSYAMGKWRRTVKESKKDKPIPNFAPAIELTLSN